MLCKTGRLARLMMFAGFCPYLLLGSEANLPGIAVTPVHTFQANEGKPRAGLILAPDGKLYGTTYCKKDGSVANWERQMRVAATWRESRSQAERTIHKAGLAGNVTLLQPSYLSLANHVHCFITLNRIQRSFGDIRVFQPQGGISVNTF